MTGTASGADAQQPAKGQLSGATLKAVGSGTPSQAAKSSGATGKAAGTGAASHTGGNPVTPDSKSPTAAIPSHYRPDRFAGRAGKYYELVWGVDSISVKLVESGELVRFTYRVLDPAKARVLNDKQNTASLIDPRARVSLVVPTMEKVGQLRQSAPPESGRLYWMAFSNKGRLVRRGDRVDIIVGQFHGNNLVVD